MRSVIFAAALALLAVPAPAFAADEATLGCVADGATPAARAEVERYVRGMFGEADGDAQQAVTGLDAASRVCAKRHGWSDNARKGAIAYTMATLGLETASEELRKHGSDPVRFTELFNELPQSLRENVPSGDVPPEFEAMMEKAWSEGLLPDEAAQQAATQFLALLFIRDIGLAAFRAG